MRAAGSYDLERLTPGGVTVEHYEGQISVDGPWLIMHRPGSPDLLDLIAPAHAVVALRPCEGRCHNGGE